ncbi:hypothetical protein [Methylobacterium thuringiense]|nr:hypothetical protein [Methylobacterium thuringiense]
MRKRIPQAEPYSQLFVEFENTAGAFLTLMRHLSGGDLAAHNCRIKDIIGEGDKIVFRRHGTSTAIDVTSVIFSFAGIPEATLRANKDGKTQRLSIRNFMPTIVVDEVSVIEEQSPVLGRPSYDNTARERMFAFMLSGKDDRGVVAAERRDIATARLNAQLDVIIDLLTPLEQRLDQVVAESPDETIERVDASIASVAESLSQFEDEREGLMNERQAATENMQRAESQLIAIEELLSRYRLLDERYSSDLGRLDFISEGAHYFDGLQEIKCALCDQLMTPEHAHVAAGSSETIYASARAEASKILAQRLDLENAVASLISRRVAQNEEKLSTQKNILRANTRLNSIIQPAIQTNVERLQSLLDRRIYLEATRSDREQLEGLRAKKDEIERAAESRRPAKREWEALPGKALRAFCNEVEFVLREWKWSGTGRVEFDSKKYDIIVDGQARQSHGKGVRAVLYSAFIIGLLRYCSNNNLPHIGFAIIDSPLTSYKKKGVQIKGADGPIDLGVEAAFWESLKRVSAGIQIIIVENKEPPADVAAAVQYEWFAGDTASPGDRVAFIPVPGPAGPFI